MSSSRSIVVRLRAEIAGYKAAMQDAARATKQVGESAKQASQANFSKLTASIRDNRGAWDDLSSKAMVGGLALAAGIGAATKAAIDWESAWAGVAKTVDGTPEQLSALEGELRGLARTLPATHEEIAGVAEAAGQLGVARGDIADFTKTAIALGEATNLSAEEAATGLAKISNVMGTMDREGVAGIERMGSALVALGNDGASTEADILAMAQRLSGAGAMIGATEADILAMGSALSSVGIEAELGGGAMSRGLQKMNTAVIEGGKELDAFAKVAGMSADQFAQKWRSDPIAAANDFVSGLGRVNDAGGDAAAVLSELGLGGTQNAQVFLRAAGASDLLTKSLKLGADSYEANLALWKEAETRYQTTESRLQIARNQARDAAIDFGDALAPAVAKAAETGAKLVSSFSALPAPLQKAAGGTTAAAAGLLLFGGGAVKAIGAAQDLKATLDTLGASGGKTGRALGALGGAAGPLAAIAVGAAIAIPALDALGDKMDEATGYATKADAELKNFLADGDVAGLRDAAEATDGWGGKLAGLSDKINKVAVVTRALPQTAWQQQRANLEGFDRVLADMVSSGHGELAAQQIEKAGISAEDAAKLLPEYSNAAKDAEASAKLAGDGAKDGAAGIDGMGQSAEEAAEDLKALQSELTMLGGGLRAEREAVRQFDQALADAKEAVSGTAAEQEAALDGMAEAALDVAAAQVEMGRGSDVITTTLARAREQIIQTGMASGRSREYMEQYADAMGLIPEDVTTMVEARGVEESTANVLELDESIRLLDGKTVTVEEEGANPSTGRVVKLDGAIFGLDGKTVKVQEIGSTASGDRVVRFRGEIYKLSGKTVNVHATTSGMGSLQAMSNTIAAMNSKNITIGVTTRYAVAGRGGGGVPMNADGGLYDSAAGFGLVRRFADGGWAGTLGQARPQIRAAGGAGVLWAEDGAGPWEAFISGHPAKKDRSRHIWLETGKRLGLLQAYADGGMHATRQYVAPPVAPRVVVQTAAGTGGPVRMHPADIEALADAMARRPVDLYPSQRAYARDMTAVRERWAGR